MDKDVKSVASCLAMRIRNSNPEDIVTPKEKR
ncbi:hypothetical protein T4B_1455 [Trichinella pseudospiralis]|uniref:Uncharacterized protein n=2 Tax=Trichinella pseudospiralis TaxID=6337 RepID=A0A0V1C4Z4_TRIPS|nr:hypothetical protein T4D_7724 [Trichinella pseudospiralis]KRY80517.1 hypothetical protein T4B_1455 [Trichinella pseudospiralis]